jgi:hypothetical protein
MVSSALRRVSSAFALKEESGESESGSGVNGNEELKQEDPPGIENIIIVSHGVTIRAWVCMWCHYSPEWFEASINPPNCSVRLLTNAVEGWDAGYIYGGFGRDGKPADLEKLPKEKDPIFGTSKDLYAKWCYETQFKKKKKINTSISKGCDFSLMLVRSGFIRRVGYFSDCRLFLFSP